MRPRSRPSAQHIDALGIDPVEEFHAAHYIRHNQRRLEHLASLGLPIAGRTIMEVGAGVGDHTSFFLDRECSVLTSDGRPENVEILRRRYPWITVHELDLDRPDPGFLHGADIVYCYGLLYHLARPEQALAFLAERCGSMLLLETCVSFGDTEELNLCAEPAEHPTQSMHGGGCRPARLWVFNRLRALFPHVYVPRTQPWHPEFPLDWSKPADNGLARAVFIASREPLTSPVLASELLATQTRH